MVCGNGEAMWADGSQRFVASPAQPMALPDGSAVTVVSRAIARPGAEARVGYQRATHRPEASRPCRAVARAKSPRLDRDHRTTQFATKIQRESECGAGRAGGGEGDGAILDVQAAAWVIFFWSRVIGVVA